MLSVEYIKKGCAFADGFEYNFVDFVKPGTSTITYTNKSRIITLDIKGLDWLYTVYPLFLQRVIEGINKKSYLENAPLEIKLFRWGIDIIDNRLRIPKNNIKYFRYETKNVGEYLTDQAKEEAIKYVLENS